MHNTMVTRINNTVLPSRPPPAPPFNETLVNFPEHGSSNKNLLFIYYLFTHITTSNIFHLQIYFKIYLPAHKTQVMLLFFPGVLRLLRPANSHPRAKSWHVRWGNSGLQDTLEFSLKTVKSQEASL